MEAFTRKVVISDDGCWEWLGYYDKDGYAMLDVRNFNGRRETRAARIAYELYVEPIPEGLQIDHLCRNKGCVNPAHLEAVTPFENNSTRRRQAYGTDFEFPGTQITHCVNGHEATPENRGISVQGNRRVTYCRVCKKERARARRKAAHG